MSATAVPEDRLTLRPTEVAKLLGVSHQKVYEWIATGQIPGFRVDGVRLIHRRRLEEWIDEQTNEQAAR